MTLFIFSAKKSPIVQTMAPMEKFLGRFIIFYKRNYTRTMILSIKVLIDLQICFASEIWIRMGFLFGLKNPTIFFSSEKITCILNFVPSK